MQSNRFKIADGAGKGRSVRVWQWSIRCLQSAWSFKTLDAVPDHFTVDANDSEPEADSDERSGGQSYRRRRPDASCHRALLDAKTPCLTGLRRSPRRSATMTAASGKPTIARRNPRQTTPCCSNENCVSTATIELDIPKIFIAQESELLPKKAREFLIRGREEDLSLSAHRQLTQMVKKGQHV